MLSNLLLYFTGKLLVITRKSKIRVLINLFFGLNNFIFLLLRLWSILGLY
jgi:hypothetical protein